MEPMMFPWFKRLMSASVSWLLANHVLIIKIFHSLGLRLVFRYNGKRRTTSGPLFWFCLLQIQIPEANVSSSRSLVLPQSSYISSIFLLQESSFCSSTIFLPIFFRVNYWFFFKVPFFISGHLKFVVVSGTPRRVSTTVHTSPDTIQFLHRFQY